MEFVLAALVFLVIMVVLFVGSNKLGDKMIKSKSFQKSLEQKANLQAAQIEAQVRSSRVNGTKAKTPTELAQEGKKASIAKRAVVGAAIAGETGAIIGAASAINENLKNKE